jgi:hypothetical protein
MRLSLCLVLLCLGCAKRAVEQVEFGGAAAAEQRAGASVPGVDVTEDLLNSGDAVQESGLALEIPPDWYGQMGGASSARWLSLHHKGSRVTVEFWKYPRSETVEPRPQGGCEWTFVDGGAYANISQLGAASVATCVPEIASEPARQSWIVLVGDVQWHIEARFLAGTLISARGPVEALLADIKATED